ncbi:MAG: ABC transporter substrate-binding protein [Candidatus Limivivens sp.]|nr:ABC transporter substrate-binding protein [Candidatus Limivivens sp.]
MKMRKTMAVLLAAALTAGMTSLACRAEGTVNTKEEINLGFIQLVDMADATEMYEAFTKQLEDKGYADKIHIDFVDAAGDATAMVTGLQKFVDEEVDLIVPMLTPPTQAAVSMDSGIPIIFMSVVDPVYSKVMSDWDTVNNLATGTSNTIPADLIMETAFDITPLEEGKKVCIIYNSAQNNSQCTMEAACKYLDEIGVEYVVKEYTDIATAVQVAQSIDPDEIGIVYSTLDSTIASNFNQVGEALTEAGIPSYAAADAMTKGGAFCSYGVSYTVVGQMTADMVIEWFDGKALEDMPCQQYSDFQLIINSDVQEALGIELSDEYSEAATYVTTVAAS